MSGDPIIAALARLEAGQTRLEARLTGLETAQRGLEASLTGLEAGQTRLEAAQSRLEAGQTALRTEMTGLRVDLMDRMDRLENKLTEVRDDIAVNFGATDTVKRANDNTREELRSLGETVSAMYRVVRRLDDRVRHLEDGAPTANAG